MPSTPRSAETSAQAQALAQAICEATQAEIDRLAQTLLDTDDRHLFGQNEFKIRAIALQIAAKAVEQHLARKKTATKAAR